MAYLGTRRRALTTGVTGLAAGTLAAMSMAPSALADDSGANGDGNVLNGLWHDVVTLADNSIPPFETFDVYADGIGISSGQIDQSPQTLSSSAFIATRRIGARRFRFALRFWTYDAKAQPSGFGAGGADITVSKDGNGFTGSGPLQFFDSAGKPVGPSTTSLFNATRIRVP
jgi:hypothetical protein